MKMLTKKECMDALNKMINTSYSRWYRSHGKTAKPYFLDGFHKNPVYKGDYKALKVIDKLIKEYFELVELLKPHGYGMLSAEEFEHWISWICKHNADNDMIIMSQNEQLDVIKNPQPYKFEELKKGMWVWDDGEKCCFKCNPAISTDMAQCVTYNAFWYNCGEDEDEFFEEYDEFEENRFYPVTKAMEYQK